MGLGYESDKLDRTRRCKNNSQFTFKGKDKHSNFLETLIQEVSEGLANQEIREVTAKKGETSLIVIH